MKRTLLPIIISTVFIAILYMAINTWLMNVSLLKSTILGDYPFTYKFDLLMALLGGMWTAMSGFGLTMLIIIALLTGANLTLMAQRIISMRSFGKLQFVAGGGSILGFIGSGCATCGLPILALLGLSGSAMYLPFKGAELSLMSAVLLLMSLYLMVKSELAKKVC